MTEEQYSHSLKKNRSATRTAVWMKLAEIIQQALWIMPTETSATNIIKREKFLSPQNDQNCTYIKYVPPYHTILNYNQLLENRVKYRHALHTFSTDVNFTQYVTYP
jgi:hypothetical protein